MNKRNNERSFDGKGKQFRLSVEDKTKNSSREVDTVCHKQSIGRTNKTNMHTRALLMRTHECKLAPYGLER